MKERKRTISLGVLFWIAAILLVLVVFLFNRKNIEQVMENTGFVEVINQRIGIDNSPGNTDNPPGQQDNPDTETVQDEPETQGSPSNDPADETVGEPEAEVSEERKEVSSETEVSQEEDEPPPKEPEQSTKNREYLIHLVRMGDDGSISLEAVKRVVNFIASPLTETLKSLIEEPGTDGNYHNLIPPNTVLNRVWINGGTAFVDLSEDFRFNPIGLEGYRLQVQQIIATATQFSSVKTVQILIDGQQVDFLGGDGFFIGRPLGQTDL